MWDKKTSYKFVGGKLVPRTAEEHAKLVELRKAASHNKPAKAARSKESFIMISQTQQERWTHSGCHRAFASSWSCCGSVSGTEGGPSTYPPARFSTPKPSVEHYPNWRRAGSYAGFWVTR
jgi:hypothetical protein